VRGRRRAWTAALVTAVFAGLVTATAVALGSLPHGGLLVLAFLLVVVPMTLLLEGCILISAYWEKQKKTAEAALLASGVEQGSTPD